MAVEPFPRLSDVEVCWEIASVFVEFSEDSQNAAGVRYVTKETTSLGFLRLLQALTLSEARCKASSILKVV